MIVQTSPSPIVSYPGYRSAARTAAARSHDDAEAWLVIKQLKSGWYTAISASLLADPHVAAGVPYSTIARFERGKKVQG